MSIKAIPGFIRPIFYVLPVAAMIGFPTAGVPTACAQEAGTSGGDVVDFGSRTNIIHHRVTAASDFVDALGEYLEGEGEFLFFIEKK